MDITADPIKDNCTPKVVKIHSSDEFFDKELQAMLKVKDAFQNQPTLAANKRL